MKKWIKLFLLSAVVTAGIVIAPAAYAIPSDCSIAAQGDCNPIQYATGYCGRSEGYICGDDTAWSCFTVYQGGRINSMSCQFDGYADGGTDAETVAGEQE